MFEIHKSKIWDAYDKNCWFYEWAKLSYFTFKNGQETGTEFIAFWHQFVCSGLLNRIVPPIFGVVLMKILWRTMRMMLKKALTHKLTSHVVSCDVLTARFKVLLKRNFRIWDFCLIINFEPYLEILPTFFSHTVSENCFFSHSKLTSWA